MENKRNSENFRLHNRTTDREIAVSIDKWLKTNVFHHSQFADVRKLVQKKEQQNIKISLCLPTLNEEKTVGKEVVILKSELIDRHHLLDEIVVIDSGSSDKHVKSPQHLAQMSILLLIFFLRWVKKKAKEKISGRQYTS